MIPRRIEIEGRYITSDVCGSRCMFCHFEQTDDSYHCVFFPEEEDTFIVNVCAEEGGTHWNCPVRLKG